MNVYHDINTLLFALFPVDVRVRVPGGGANPSPGIPPLLTAPHPLHRGGQRGPGLHQGALLQPRRPTHLLAVRLWRSPAGLWRELRRAGWLPACADQLPPGDPLHLLTQRRGAHHQVLPDTLPAGLGLPERPSGPLPAQVLIPTAAKDHCAADLDPDDCVGSIRSTCPPSSLLLPFPACLLFCFLLTTPLSTLYLCRGNSILLLVEMTSQCIAIKKR